MTEALRLLLATRNPHKAQEIGGMLQGLPIRVATLEEFPVIPEVEEDGKTLEDNAAKKALFAARESGLWSLADDTGLEVAALQGAPGVYSARYAGPDCNYDDNNKKLLQALTGVPSGRRRAVFRCVMALASPDSRIILEEGRIEGLITENPRGKNGFGYDPIFLLPDRGLTLSEIPMEEKNGISHRALALRNIRVHLERLAMSRKTALIPSHREDRKISVCVRCGLEMEAWHCREVCPGCGYQIDCSDPF